MTLDDAMLIVRQVQAHGQRWRVDQIEQELNHIGGYSVRLHYMVRQANTKRPDIDVEMLIAEYQPFEEIIAGMRG